MIEVKNSNCSPVYSPHLSLPRRNINYLLLLKVKLPPLSDVICLLPSFSLINVFKGTISDVDIFKEITDSFRLFYFFYQL